MHTLHGLRATFPSELDVVDHLRLKRNGTNFALNGARDALASAEALLVTILSLPDDSMLSTAPDSYFAMLSFSAALIIAIKFIMLHLRDIRQIPGATTQLLTKTVDRLMKVALFPDHHAMRTAHVIQDFITKWEAHAAKIDGPHSGDANTQCPPASAPERSTEHITTNNDASTPSATTSNTHLPNLLNPAPMQPQLMQEIVPSFDDFDFLQTNADGRSLGLDFWQYFADNTPMGTMPPSPCELTLALARLVCS